MKSRLLPYTEQGFLARKSATGTQFTSRFIYLECASLQREKINRFVNGLAERTIKKAI